MKQVSIVFYWGYLGPRMIFFVRHECHKVFFQPAAFTNIKWHIFYNSLLTYICLLKPCYRQMYWIRDNILTLTTHSYFDYSSGYIFVYWNHSFPEFSTFLQNRMYLVVHKFKSPNCQPQWYCFFYNWSIWRCDTKSSLKFLCTFTVSRVLWFIIEASLFNIVYSQMLW